MSSTKQESEMGKNSRADLIILPYKDKTTIITTLTEKRFPLMIFTLHFLWANEPNLFITGHVLI